ncbi:hypothetical protein LPJ53_001142 [Coemansia erecta]|uniref:Uncharacterized protein n=1 Tax=Coemansia erecta TaxID=147472 RepID=A0A9W7Y0L3_9FUNG|nr:hypothetical protein LPJ53_001142 [Coemansia erecta]
MRVGIGATGIYPGASGLGSGSGSGGTGSAHLRMPRGTLKGKAAATATTVRNRGNPEAKPTNAWLTGQRHYKIGQLRLLTLDSFYPSDTAMLQVFRQHDDFTPEQIEQYGAALLSWARGWLRYNRNAVLRHLLMSKGTVPLNQLAEVLQHDMHSTESFTTPENLRRCALLRATHYEWHASRKMGNKSMSVFRDYESALREIESLPMAEEQEARWAAVLQEEQIRRAAFIREARLNTADATAAAGSSGSTPAVARTRARQRGSSMVQAAETPMPSSLLSGSGGTTDMHAAVGKDDDSEMSVNISPEPGNH